MILLTSDELATAYGYDNPHRVAQAQLKKVVDRGDVEEVVNGYSVSFFISDEEMQVLKKEAGL